MLNAELEHLTMMAEMSNQEMRSAWANLDWAKTKLSKLLLEGDLTDEQKTKIEKTLKDVS